jgi:predicted ATPase
MAETAALYERIRSASTAVPHNLPPQFTPFVGRLDELAWLNRRLDDPGCRLLTLAGSGGAGKTRLALEIVAERAGDYLNGAAFVPLASIDDPDLLVTAVAEAIRFTFSGSKPPKQQLLDHLHGLEMLLALDNFEQVLEGAGLVADILKAAPRVTILATSREPLNLSMEWLLTVHGLAYPGAAEEARPLAQYEAAQLFDHNARRASARFALNDASAPFVGRICQLVEGLPLALELAAAAVRERPLAEIAAAIEENTAVLATTMRDVPPRHRSVQAVFNHSWSRLTPSQRRIFARLTVFRGSFDRAAAKAVSGAAPETLARLVQKSLLRRENGRYHLHALWRQLGAEKLSAEEREEAQAAHGRYYTGWMQQQEANLTGDAQLNTLALITADIENIRAAWNWAVRQRQWEAIRQAVDSFNDWHNIRALFREGTAVYEQAIVALKEALKSKTGAPASSRPASRDAGAPGADVLLAQLLTYQGFFLFRQAEFGPAKAKLQESAALLRPLDEPRLLIKALGGLANIAIMQGDYETAGRQYRENLALARRAGLPGAIASNLEGTAMLANYAGEFDKAQRLFRQCLAMQREIGNLHQIASTLGNLATASFYLEQYAEAEKALVESLELRRSLDDQHGVILMLLNLGELALFTQEYEKARRFYEECGRVSAAARHRLGDVDSRVGLGDVCFALGEYDTAASHYLAAINMAQTAKLLPNLLLALVGMAGVLFKREQVGEAAVVFAFVQRHPALNQEIKDKGAWLAAALPPEARAAGEAQAAGMSLVEVVTAVGKDEG